MTGPSEKQHRAMHRLFRLAEVPDRPARLALTGAIVGRTLASSNELTAEEAARILRYMGHLDHTGQLAAQARGWLHRNRTAAN